MRGSMRPQLGHLKGMVVSFSYMIRDWDRFPPTVPIVNRMMRAAARYGNTNAVEDMMHAMTSMWDLKPNSGASCCVGRTMCGTSLCLSAVVGRGRAAVAVSDAAVAAVRDDVGTRRRALHHRVVRCTH